MFEKNKKTIFIASAVVVLLVLFFCWQLWGPATRKSKNGYFCIKTGTTYEQLLTQLTSEGVLSGTTMFNMVAKYVSYPSHVKPGRYEIRDGMSVIDLIRMLKSGNQKPIRLVIKKLRTKEDFAGLIGRYQFEADSNKTIQFLNDQRLLSTYGLDTSNVMSVFIPNSYDIYWDGSFEKIFTRLKKMHDVFWKGKREKRAAELGFTPAQIYTIASIVEEETTKETDMPLIASVYLNRLKKNMKLEADPTVKFAMRNFGLTRILNEHLSYPSAYNTYYSKGLPPGPICTPSTTTIDAVLNAPSTEYLFFVAKPDFSGYSNFAKDYPTHLKYAREYQSALDILQAKKSNSKH